MRNITLTTISPSLVNLFTFSRVSRIKSCICRHNFKLELWVETTLNPMHPDIRHRKVTMVLILLLGGLVTFSILKASSKGDAFSHT